MAVYRPTNHRLVTETIADEPRRMLLPITGYAARPLLTLEEACQPLVTLINDLPRFVQVAKKNTRSPANGLSHDESAAIHLYTMEWTPSGNSLYVRLNRMLRAPGRSLKLFLTALAKLPPLSSSTQSQVVWRGVKLDMSARYVKDSYITWWAFSSCTRSLSLLESNMYLGQTGDRTIFNIETINGKDISSHSHFGQEDEVLLMPGTYMKVVSQLNPAPNLHMIQLKEIVPPVQLLEPPFHGKANHFSQLAILFLFQVRLIDTRILLRLCKLILQFY
jgi:hypothetical protein